MVMLAQTPPTHFQLKFIFHIHRIPLLFRRSPATNTCCKIHFITTTTTTAIVTIANSCYTCIAVTIWTDSTPNASPYLPGMRWTALANTYWFSGTMSIVRAYMHQNCCCVSSCHVYPRFQYILRGREGYTRSSSSPLLF
eukprot:296681_1